MVLQNPRVDFAVFEVARGGILREGLGYERNDVGVVLNVQPDHLGLRGVDTLEQLADVKAVIVEAVAKRLRCIECRRPAGARHAATLLRPDCVVQHGRARQRNPRFR
jgi:UDP-N-acetylmuramyl tripeptide synthase